MSHMRTVIYDEATTLEVWEDYGIFLAIYFVTWNFKRKKKPLLKACWHKYGSIYASVCNNSAKAGIKS